MEGQPLLSGEEAAPSWSTNRGGWILTVVYLFGMVSCSECFTGNKPQICCHPLTRPLHTGLDRLHSDFATQHKDRHFYRWPTNQGTCAMQLRTTDILWFIRALLYLYTAGVLL